MIYLDSNKCNSCGLCVKKCMFSAVSMVDKRPVFGDNCVFCGACVEACPAHAIEINIQKVAIQDFSDYSGIWAVMQMDSKTQKPKKVSYELLSEARKLADTLGQKVSAVCLCKTEPQELRGNLKLVGCDELILVENDQLAEYDTDIFTAIISELIRKYKPSSVLYPATEDGRDLAPRISARLKVGLTADCTALDIDAEQHLIQIRPTYGGNIMASIITPDYRPQMASVRPNVFLVNHAGAEKELEVTKVSFDIDGNAKRVQRIGFKPKEVVYKDVAEAQIIISGGYGLGAENFKLLHELAIKTGAAVGATRKAVDEGWAPFDIQIGQTGKTVAPDLYIACGISGALQHSIGIKNAKKVIAINNDPVAPIFSQSDVAILGDVRQILMYLLELAEGKGKETFIAL